MPSLEDEVAELVGEVAELFDWEEFAAADVDIDVLESDDVPFPYCDVLREDTEQVFRMFVTPEPVDLNVTLADYFGLFRDLESEFDDTAAVLAWRATGEEDFWYMERTDEGEIGLFHSDLSLDEDEDEEEEETESF